MGRWRKRWRGRAPARPPAEALGPSVAVAAFAAVATYSLFAVVAPDHSLASRTYRFGLADGLPWRIGVGSLAVALAVYLLADGGVSWRRPGAPAPGRRLVLRAVARRGGRGHVRHRRRHLVLARLSRGGQRDRGRAAHGGAGVPRRRPSPSPRRSPWAAGRGGRPGCSRSCRPRCSNRLGDFCSTRGSTPPDGSSTAATRSSADSGTAGYGTGRAACGRRSPCTPSATPLPSSPARCSRRTVTAWSPEGAAIWEPPADCGDVQGTERERAPAVVAAGPSCRVASREAW